MEESFRSMLTNKVNESLKNNYGQHNFWSIQYGNYYTDSGTLKRKLKEILKPAIKPIIERPKKREAFLKLQRFIDTYEEEYNLLFTRIDENSKQIMVELIAYKLLGSDKVKLSTNTKKIWEDLELVKNIENKVDTIQHRNIDHLQLSRFDLSSLGYDIDFYYLANGVMIDFVNEQFRYNISGKIIEAEPGDVVLECGACWGASALYFSHKVGVSGEVHSFEFIPENIRIYRENMKLNPSKSNIRLVEHPVFDSSNKEIYFTDAGPSSVFSFEPFDGYSEMSQTISIDDYVMQNSLQKVDMLTMDVEGAEQPALRGAIETIKKFKPKLAISIYHSDDDFVQIPNWILDLNLGYKVYVNHYTIYGHETVCFATID